MLEAAQPSVPCFARRETVPATARSPSSRNLTRLEPKGDRQQQQGLRVLSDGAHPNATSGGTKDVATTQSANRREIGLVGG